jgi:GNAT superfamily N-acetyltransferase
MINKKYRFNHIGIPTKEKLPNETYLEKYRMYVSGYEKNDFNIEKMRFEEECEFPKIVKEIPHIAFEVDNLQEEIKGRKVIIEPNMPSEDVIVAFIEENNSPIELMQYVKNKEKEKTDLVNNITFKIGSMNDIESLVEMRMKFCKELGSGSYNEDELKKSTVEYIQKGIRNRDYIGVLGYDSNTIVCTSGILIYTLPPLQDQLNRKQGHILNFYTIKEYRNRGIGMKMMDYLLQIGKMQNINRFFLFATKMGEPLYRKAGFYEQEEIAMIMKI